MDSYSLERHADVPADEGAALRQRLGDREVALDVVIGEQRTARRDCADDFGNAPVEVI